jgi:argininosuccinate lyase
MDTIAMANPKPPLDASSPGGWSGRFGEPVSPLVKRYTASVDFDCRLAAVDIAGSLAHARMLTAAGVLPWLTSPRSSAV